MAAGSSQRCRRKERRRRKQRGKDAALVWLLSPRLSRVIRNRPMWRERLIGIATGEIKRYWFKRKVTSAVHSEAKQQPEPRRGQSSFHYPLHDQTHRKRSSQHAQEEDARFLIAARARAAAINSHVASRTITATRFASAPIKTAAGCTFYDCMSPPPLPSTV